MAETSPGCARSGDRGTVRRGRQQLLHNCRAPFIDKIKSALVLGRGLRTDVANSMALRTRKRVVPIQARPPIIFHPAGTPPGVAARDAKTGVFAGFGQRWRKRLLAPDEYWLRWHAMGADFVHARLAESPEAEN